MGTTTIASGSSLPWWCWLLLVLLVGLCIVTAFAVRSFLAPKKPKKKRAMEVAPESDLESSSTPLQPSGSSTDRSATLYAQAQNLFDQIDTNHDGVITEEEYARWNLFDQIDTNHDGVITREEYAQLQMHPRPVQFTSVPIAQAFQLAGPTKARTVVPVYPGAAAPVRQSLFDQLDTNHD